MVCSFFVNFVHDCLFKMKDVLKRAIGAFKLREMHSPMTKLKHHEFSVMSNVGFFFLLNIVYFSEPFKMKCPSIISIQRTKHGN